MSAGYTLREVGDILGLPRSVIAGFVDAGFVAPARGPRREYRFGFADLVVMRAAKALIAANVPPQRLTRALRRLRQQLPDEAPRGRMRIESDGNALVVSEGPCRWRADSGQYVLAFEVAQAPDGVVRFVDRQDLVADVPKRDPASAAHWLERGIALEANDREGACAAYRRSIEADPSDPGAHVNLGRLLHDAGRLKEARATYESALADGVVDPTLFFNYGVLLEDLGLPQLAADAYGRTIAAAPSFADAHYNLALLHASAGQQQQAVRHFNAYRQLTRSDGS